MKPGVDKNRLGKLDCKELDMLQKLNHKGTLLLVFYRLAHCPAQDLSKAVDAFDQHSICLDVAFAHVGLRLGDLVLLVLAL